MSDNDFELQDSPQKLPKYKADVTQSISKLGKNVMMKHLEYYRKKNEDEFGNPLKIKSDKKDKRGDEDQEYSSDESFDKQLLEEIKEV